MLIAYVGNVHHTKLSPFHILVFVAYLLFIHTHTYLGVCCISPCHTHTHISWCLLHISFSYTHTHILVFAHVGLSCLFHMWALFIMHLLFTHTHKHNQNENEATHSSFKNKQSQKNASHQHHHIFCSFLLDSSNLFVLLINQGHNNVSNNSTVHTPQLTVVIIQCIISSKRHQKQTEMANGVCDG